VWLTTEADDQSSLHCIIVLTDVMSDHIGRRDANRGGGCLKTSEYTCAGSKKISPYSITECRVPELIPVLGSQPAGDVSHKPGGRLPLLSARPAFTPQRGLLPVSVFGEQRHDGCEQFA